MEFTIRACRRTSFFDDGPSERIAQRGCRFCKKALLKSIAFIYEGCAAPGSRRFYDKKGRLLPPLNVFILSGSNPNF
jgi:hypothetical protein